MDACGALNMSEHLWISEEHHSRTNSVHLEQLFVFTISRNLLKFPKEHHLSHFNLIYEGGLYARP